ncbi:hypothetical protein ACWELB_14620 [Streptomyces asiaticus]|uniref:hypothetical protein n=1 Tax=Streptomyces asiaticus TaxID=114695 RepID=UPI003D71EAA0
MTMKGGSLLRNRSAVNNGGGLENIRGTATLESVSVRGNTAMNGGGIRKKDGAHSPGPALPRGVLSSHATLCRTSALRCDIPG